MMPRVFAKWHGGKCQQISVKGGGGTANEVGCMSSGGARRKGMVCVRAQHHRRNRVATLILQLN